MTDSELSGCQPDRRTRPAADSPGGARPGGERPGRPAASANWALLMMTVVSKISAIRSHTYDTYKNVIYL